MGRARTPAAIAAALLRCCPAAPADPVCGAGTAAAISGRRPGSSSGSPDRVLMLGDAQYRDGLYHKFLASYGGPGSWGLPADHPAVPGNGLHRLRFDPEAGGYYTPFGRVLNRYGPVAADPARGWYSFDLRVRNRRTRRAARWHLVALNSMCGGLLAEVIGWRRAARPARSRCVGCAALYHRRVDVILNGNLHGYERLAPQAPAGRRSRRGVRQFIVGTGGQTLHPPPPRRARTSRAFASRTHGVLSLALHGPTRARPCGWFRWRFHPDARTRSPADRGSASCVAPCLR